MQRLLVKPVVSLALGACLGLAAAAGAADKGAAAKAAAPAPAAAPVPAFVGGKGKVLETMNSGGYTYVKVDLGGKPAWAAGPQAKVKKGQTVTLSPGMPMVNYQSPTLKRTFDVVYFVSAIDVGGKGAPAAAPAAGPAAGPHAKPAVANAKVKGVKKAQGGQTVAECFSSRKGLSGKEVTVRGKVVKVSSGIMGKNWLHLQDGTGAAGSNDLTVTTAGTAAVGDVVLVKGKLAADKDFGMGYRYDAIVEDAQVTKQ